MSEITGTVASFVSDARWSQLPDQVRDAAVSTLASTLSLRPMGHGQMTRVLSSVAAEMRRGASKTSDEPFGAKRPYFAVMQIGAKSFSALDEGASDLEELASVVIPSAVIATEVATGSGEQLLVGVALGMEVALRAVVSLGDAHRERGWDIVGTAGRLGATVAASVVLGLGATELQSALGFASTTAAGLSIAGRELRALGAGRAAADALEAAVLAGQGLIGPPEPLEGRRGLFALECGDPHPEELIDGLGVRWLFVQQLAPAPLDQAASALIGAADISAFMAVYRGTTDLTD